MSSPDDHFNLAANENVKKLLQKHGSNVPQPEQVIFSDFVVKINRRDKEQIRVLLITDKAVYNLVPSSSNGSYKCKRRIDLLTCVSVTASSVSDEFVIHVPDEYDYRFKSAKKDEICDLLAKLYKARVENSPAQFELKQNNSQPLPKKLAIKYLNEPDLKEQTVTKALARLQTREDILRRKRLLAAEQHDSDQEDENDSRDAKKQDSFTPIDTEGAPSTLSKEKVRLEDFELLKVLGRGSFGKVMQVRKKSDRKVYAMKILKKKAIIARNQVEHTKAERNILQTLQHPFLMTLRYAFQSKDKLYFVLDYYQGGELFFHLRQQRRFSEDVARIYVAEIALALGHLHSLSVIYRDLKPENILLDENGHVCLTDFGLSKDMEPDGKAHTFCGTPEYLAPEIITNAGHDKAVDWWSLGILLYELTVGIPPFYSQDQSEMYKKIQHGVLRFPVHLTEHCKSLIVALLHRDPKKRLGSGNDIDDIKSHPFFASIDWNKLMKKQIDVPYKPRVKGNEDTSNFDSTFTAEPVVDSVVASSVLSQSVAANSEDNFSGFTYVQKSGLLK